jgi:serine phosphatase RsbU (regulator of sigma subunit)/CheY-like chemotaxis protein
LSPSATTSAAPAIEPITILLVDDDPGILETLVEIFEDMGYNARTASTGRQALNLLRERSFNLALLDIRLPDMDGTELLAEARQLQPSLKCVMATGNTTLQPAIDSLNQGAYAYLLKPVDVPNVKDTVRRALEQQRLELQNKLLLDITDAALATLELDELLTSVLGKFVAYYRADGGEIFLMDSIDGMLVPRVQHGGLSAGPVRLGQGLAGRVGKEECIIAATGSLLSSDPIAAQGIQAAIAAPLSSRNRLVGAIRLDWRGSRIFTVEEEELLQVLSERAAVQIDNARQYDEERHLAHNLVERIDLEERIELICRYLMNVTGVNRSVVWLGAGDSLMYAGSVNLDLRHERLLRRIEASFQELRPEVRRILESGRATVATGDALISLLPDELLEQAGVRSVLLVPLRFEGRAIGLISLDQPHIERGFSELQVRQATTVAFMSAGAIQQARTIQEERHMARTLAESFLSTTPVRTDVQLASYYEPASEVAQIGGDYYDFIELDRHHLGIVIGDVCGKGLTAAIYTGKAKDMLYAYARENFEVALEAGQSPSTQWVITRLNRALYTQMSEDCMFITMMYGVLDTRTGAFTYTNAAHPPPILYQPESARLVELAPGGAVQVYPELDGDGTAEPSDDRPVNGMVGAFENMTFTEHTIALEPSSVLTMFTDGVTEARSGGVMLQSEGVRDVVREHYGERADRIANAIYSRASEFAQGRLRDDVAIIVVKLAPSG